MEFDISLLYDLSMGTSTVPIDCDGANNCTIDILKSALISLQITGWAYQKCSMHIWSNPDDFPRGSFSNKVSTCKVQKNVGKHESCTMESVNDAFSLSN